MVELNEIYKNLLESNTGDVTIKLKDEKEIKIISYIINNRSPVFKTMMDSEMKEKNTGVVDLSKQYTLEAFKDFMSYIYYNKMHNGVYIPLLFEILEICNYYDVKDYKSYIYDRIVELIDSMSISLIIAKEALKYAFLTEDIYEKCIEFLKKPKISACYDSTSNETVAWCCANHSIKNKGYHYVIDRPNLNGKRPCIYITAYNNYNGSHLSVTSDYETTRCCEHGEKIVKHKDIEFPEFILEDLKI